jgi:hypothetical protein
MNKIGTLIVVDETLVACTTAAILVISDSVNGHVLVVEDTGELRFLVGWRPYGTDWRSTLVGKGWSVIEP